MPTILVTNWMMLGRSGTETHTRDLVLGLKERGHRPMILTFHPGELAEQLRSQGIPVVKSVNDLPWQPDLVHGHHNFITVHALCALPRTPGIFVCHDARSWHDRAPGFPRILAYAAVDDLCRERIASDLDRPIDSIKRIGNSVDMARFKARGQLPSRPKRAAVFSNYAAEHTFLRVIREACLIRGLELDTIGSGAANSIDNPECILGNYDIVFGKARSAMEALACGCAVILCGPDGVGPMVTPDNFHDLRRYNFGRRFLVHPHQVDHLLKAIDTWDQTDHQSVTALARANLGLDTMLDQWIDLYQEVLSQPCPHDTQSELPACAELFSSLSPQLFSLFELHNEVAALRHENRRLKHRLKEAKTRNKASSQGAEKEKAGRQLEEQKRFEATGKTSEKFSALHSQNSKHDDTYRLSGLIRSCWKRPWLRPIALALGIRRHRH